MSCLTQNLTYYIDNINHNCDNDISVIEDECQVICLTNILVLINECMNFLIQTGLKNEMESIIKWCYYEKYISH